MSEKTTYEWGWSRLSLWRRTDDGCGGSCSRVLTLWPPWLWRSAWNRLRYGPDPFDECARWLKKHNHWDDKDFLRAVCWWYRNSSAPGTLIRLNPKLIQ